MKLRKKLLRQLKKQVKNAVNEMRTLIWQLKPVGLEHGLVQALNQYAQILNIKLTINVEGIISLSNIVEENVYRILQECINNTKNMLKLIQCILF